MIIGIVGGGQLARMMALAGYPLGLRFIVLDPSPEACASDLAEQIQGAYDDPESLARLAEKADLVTFDFENVPAAAVRRLQRQVTVLPPPSALDTAQDRLTEKALFQDLGIATAPFAAVDSLPELNVVVARMGLPAVLKTRRLGYDGKGQRIMHSPTDISAAWKILGGNDLIVEGFIPFQQEVSLLALRARGGETAFYPLVENHHQNGILHLSMAPIDAGELEHQARDYATRLLDRLDYVGLLAIEFFVLNKRLLANEMAPRVHNSGHWTIEGAATNQFENHLRAILDLPLGATTALGQSAMVNFIGELPDRSAVLATGAHYHDYGKSPRPGRKLGHATLCHYNPAVLQTALEQLLAVTPTQAT